MAVISISLIALVLSFFQFGYVLFQKRTNYKVALLLTSVTEKGLLLKVAVTNESSKPLIIDSLKMRYEDDNSLAIHFVSPYSLKISEQVSTDCLPSSVKGYSTKFFYFLLTTNSPIPHNWKISNDAYTFYISCNNKKNLKIELPIVEKIVKFETLTQLEGKQL